MRPHLALNVTEVSRSVAFYERVFGVGPQKKTDGYAKFDLPLLNFTLQSAGSGGPSRVSHLGIEVDSIDEVKRWQERLASQGIATRSEENTSCCYARQDKVWFQDPDGNAWEIFVVHEQLPVPEKEASSCCAR